MQKFKNTVANLYDDLKDGSKSIRKKLKTTMIDGTVLEFIAYLYKIEGDYIDSIYKYFNKKPNLYLCVYMQPINKVAENFNYKNYIILEYFTEENETFGVCHDFTPLTIFGIIHNYYVIQTEKDFKIKFITDFINYKYYAKLFSLRHIAKYFPEFLDTVKKDIIYTNEYFKSKGMDDKLNFVRQKDGNQSFYLEDSYTIQQKDAFRTSKVDTGKVESKAD